MISAKNNYLLGSLSTMAAFFRFLSRRRSRRTQHRTEIGQAPEKKKNVLTCTIMLLDGSDLTVDVPVSLFASVLLMESALICAFPHIDIVTRHNDNFKID